MPEYICGCGETVTPDHSHASTGDASTVTQSMDAQTGEGK